MCGACLVTNVCSLLVPCFFSLILADAGMARFQSIIGLVDVSKADRDSLVMVVSSCLPIEGASVLQ